MCLFHSYKNVGVALTVICFLVLASRRGAVPAPYDIYVFLHFNCQKFVCRYIYFIHKKRRGRCPQRPEKTKQGT